MFYIVLIANKCCIYW